MSVRPTKRGGGHRRLMVVLALPAFGIALAYTVATTYVPVLVSRVSGPLVTGVA